MLRSYGKAAGGTIPELRALIKALDLQVARNQFPPGPNKPRVKAVEETMKYLQETTDAPKLKTIKGLDLSKQNPLADKTFLLAKRADRYRTRNRSCRSAGLLNSS